LKPEELDFSVTSRVPVFIGRDNRYFYDKYQGIPANGYTSMFNNILRHKNISILLNTDYIDIISNVKFNKLIFTGNIDSYFDYVYGSLPYRSLKFDFKSYETEYFQEVAQVNYPNEYEYTRITEFKHFLNKESQKTTVAFEYPCDYKVGGNEPYYPIPREENYELLKKYIKDAEKYARNVVFIGRLAEYKYYNMDQIVGVALMTFEKRIAGK
jgi:UDP-galactopyranose mutase